MPGRDVGTSDFIIQRVTLLLVGPKARQDDELIKRRPLPHRAFVLN